MPESMLSHANLPNFPDPRDEDAYHSDIRHSSQKARQTVGFMISITQDQSSRGVKK